MTDARLPDAFLTPGTSSFSEFVGSVAPEMLPSRRTLPQGSAAELAPHATTIVAATMVVPCGARSPALPVGTARRDGSRSGASAPRKSAKLDVPGVMYDADRRDSSTPTGRPSG